MKNMSRKKTLILGIAIIAACLAVSAVYMLTHRSVKREPTAQELESYAPYAVDWQAAVGDEDGDREIILALCSFTGEETIGDNVYKIYSSDTLGDYLYDFGEMMQIALLEDTTLYVQYSTGARDMVTLGYNEAGLCERSVYDLETDTLFYEQNGTAEVWTNFRNGFRWGEG